MKSSEDIRATIGRLNQMLQVECGDAVHSIVANGTWTGILNKLDDGSPCYDPYNYDLWLIVAEYYMGGVAHGLEAGRKGLGDGAGYPEIE